MADSDVTIWKRIRINAGWSLVSLGAVAVFGFAAMYFNARALGVDGLGTLAALLALTMMLEALAGMQLWQAVLALSEGRESRILGAALILNLAAAAIGVLIGVGALLWLDWQGGWAAIVLIGSQLLRTSDPLTGILRKHDRFDYLAIVRSGAGAVTLLVAAVFWHVAAPIEAYLIAFALVFVGTNAVLLAKVWQLCVPERPARGETLEVLKFCLPTGLSGAVGAVRQRGMIVLLGALAGSSMVGIYAVADRIASLMQMLYRAAFEAVFREMPTAPNPLRLAGVIAAFGLFTSLAALAAVYWLGVPIIELVAGPEFVPAAATLNWLVLAICLSLTTLGMRALTIVKIGPGAMLKCNLFALIALLAAPWMIGQHGAVGAAMIQVLFEILWIGAVLLVMLRNWSSLSTPAQG